MNEYQTRLVWRYMEAGYTKQYFAETTDVRYEIDVTEDGYEAWAISWDGLYKIIGKTFSLHYAKYLCKEFNKDYIINGEKTFD